jgi:formamidopyrimidine-DNA glycosylase
MPEIVEVKKYCDFIRKHTLNKNIIDVKILKGRYKKHKKFEGYKMITNLLPLKLLKVESKGKFIYITFENDQTIAYGNSLVSKKIYILVS